jgi:UDP-glucose 4-epimerase
MGRFVTEFTQKGCALVTGSGGRLGKLLRAAASDVNDLSTRFVFQSSGDKADVQWSPGTSTETLPRCDAIIALWGVTSGTEAELSQNVSLVQTGVELARDLGATRMIHLSSAAVYGPGQLMDEAHPTGQTGAYGQAKCAMEAEIERQSSDTDIRHLCLRLANVVGADSLAPALANDRPAKMDRFVMPDGSYSGPLRSYIGASDLLTVFDELLSMSLDRWPDVLNVATPTRLTMDALLTSAGKPLEWTPAPATATFEATLDVSRLVQLLPHLEFADTADDQIADWRRLEHLL